MLKMSGSNEEPAASPAELEAQAWSWLRLLTSGDAKLVDAQKFRRWVQTSPAHQSAYSAVKCRWDKIAPSARELQQLKPGAIAVQKPAPASFLRQRRVFLGMAVSTAAVAGVAAVYSPLGLWPALDEWNADDQTGAGESRTLALADSVSVTLNTRTSVKWQTGVPDTGGLNLIAGEVAVELNGRGPAFAVVAGAGRSMASAGQFEVKSWNGKVCVTCLDGVMRVEHPAGARVLASGQQTIYDSKTVSGIRKINVADVSAWRKGLLVFDQIRLAEVLDEINRYRPGRVLLMNDRVRSQPVSGRFLIASLDVALWQLQEAFDLHARTLPGGLLVLS